MMRADLRRRIAARAAELAVDKFHEASSEHGYGAFPEDLLQLQHDIEDELYREMERW